MNTCRGILVLVGVTTMLAACAQPDANQASTQRSQSQAGALMTKPSSVLTLNCRVRTHPAAFLSSAARARLILARISTPSARQT